MKYQLSAQFAVLLAMQSKMGITHHISDDQGPTKRNGGRPKFKQNRRAQLKK